MKAISLWQPWATAVATGVKRIETRHWGPAHRGEIAIRAAKRWEADQREFAEQERRLGAISFGLPFGCIIAVAILADVQRVEQVEGSLTERERRWGNYAPRRFAWICKDVVELGIAVPCVGRQAIWPLELAVEREVRRLLAQA